MIFQFIVFGLLGLAIEVVWTAIYAKLFEKEKSWKLKGSVYIWMFFIYGLPSLFFGRVVPMLIDWGFPWYCRGIVYMFGIFTIEYISGCIFRKLFNWAPWDYTELTKYHLHGLIRYDYIPVWFCFGLFLEVVSEFLIRITPLIY